MSEPTTVEELRQALFTAILSGDDEALSSLCNDYTSAILEHFGTWARIPGEIREDRDAVQAWGRCLLTLAKIFEDSGLPQLMERLQGGTDNPLVRWRDTFAHAEQLREAAEYAASNDALLRVLAEMEGARGPAVDDLRPKVLGLLGANSFNLGYAQDALRYTQLALAECRRSGDAEGVRVYGENLRVLAAAAAAESGDEESVRLRRLRAAIARAQDLSDEARFDRSNVMLDELLAGIGAAGDTGAEYRGKIYGLLGLNHFRLGDRERARDLTGKALAECTAAGDAEGVRIYTANLAIIDAGMSGEKG